jgi:BolA family transcriptional regulator, general stress-responsive regulator
MDIANEIRRKLSEALAPAELDVVDESARHAGHAGARPEGETHFRVRIVSRDFEGLNRIARQRRVHEVLAKELRTHVHALSIEAKTPQENVKNGNSQ